MRISFLASWRGFIGAAIIVAGLLIKLGAPLVPIIAGVAIGAIVVWRYRGPS